MEDNVGNADAFVVVVVEEEEEEEEEEGNIHSPFGSR